jgi:hypothetical protein
MKTIFDLKLHERACFSDLEDFYKFADSQNSWILRVSSGWIFSFDGDKVFVPDVRIWGINVLQ